MEMFNEFIKNWFAHMEKQYDDGEHTSRSCRADWNFDYHRVRKGNRDPNMSIFYKYNNGIEVCPVEMFVLFNKSNIDPIKFKEFVAKEFN